MSQNMTIRVNFANIDQALIGFDLLSKNDRFHDVGWGDYLGQIVQVEFDAVLHGIYRTEQEYWAGILKPALTPIVPLSVEFTIPPTDYSETIYP